ncbi:TonB-dependent receptor [Steroidobacter sp. S1-65]|uniref:TonB-dependent receptor n=1 Tax=Steroidobacter gossypii TaxID=2805490 RepID=A0ABS1X3I9_9GAMM|nr:TonB-dependent receptor [Steroidobacter gossypii]MBM0107791.1 TonB-dependent receptor [Steroidobacter gossypii]
MATMSDSVLRWAVAAALASVAIGAAAEPAAEANIDEVVVKGQLLRAKDSAFSATVLDTETIREQALPDIDELFRLVPGMVVRDLQLGSVASNIVIRGFGNGGHGGDLGAVIDGIPLNEAMSHADGYVDLNAVVPLEIEAFTVFKGPVSALYGNYNRGGLVDIQTRKSGNYAQTDLSLSSYDTLDLQGAYGTALGDTQQINLAGQIFRTDSFRPQSATERGTFSGRWSAQLAPALQVALSSRYLQSESDSASYLTEEQFRSDPRGIDPRTQNDGADKEFLTVRGDVNYQLADELKLLTFAYATQQDFTRWFSRPVSAVAWRQREEAYDRSVFGAGASLNGVTALASVPVSYIAGIETFRESTEYKFFDGLDRRRRVLPAQSDRETDLNSVSAFAEARADVHPLAQLSLGLRADRFTGGCELRGAETGSDPCGALNQAEHVSPKVGLHSQVTDWLQLRASWAEGFALPNGFVKYSIGGQPLDENIFRQTEVGVRFVASDVFDFDVAGYRLKSTGEVRTVSPGVYENYGATLREGLEASVRWQPISSFEVGAVYGVTDTEVEQNADARLLGLSVAGVPERSGSLEATFWPGADWSINAAWRYVGEYDVDALNTLEAESYDLLDIGVSYTRPGEHGYRVYARLDNVTDEKYATSVSVIGGQLLFAPGMPRTVRAGIQFDF